MKKVSDKFKVQADNLGSPEAEAGIVVSSIRLGGQEIQFKNLNRKHFEELCRHITQAYVDGAYDDVYHGQRALAVICKTLGFGVEVFRGICLACLNGAVEITGDKFLAARYQRHLQKKVGRTVVLPKPRQPRIH